MAPFPIKPLAGPYRVPIKILDSLIKSVYLVSMMMPTPNREIRVLKNLQTLKEISPREQEVDLADLEREITANIAEESNLQEQLLAVRTRRGILLSQVKIQRPKDWKRWYQTRFGQGDSPLQYIKLARDTEGVTEPIQKQKKTVLKTNNRSSDKPKSTVIKEDNYEQCEAFDLSVTPIPDGCAEVIALIDRTFTSKLQWSYLRIFIERHEPQ